ncbi:unnamed protein product [Sphagnum jensenii]|uniref:Uncharacterized protein n=1 Tax=Sphagnum jensenii TaxID=128206 RepID=A0ABP0XEE8_9BRYO
MTRLVILEKALTTPIPRKGRSTTHKAIVGSSGKGATTHLSEDQQSICLNIIHKLLVKFKPILLPARENNT